MLGEVWGTKVHSWRQSWFRHVVRVGRAPVCAVTYVAGGLKWVWNVCSTVAESSSNVRYRSGHLGVEVAEGLLCSPVDAIVWQGGAGPSL